MAGSDAADAAPDSQNGLDKFGFAPGFIVQEIGYDNDVDDDWRFGLEDLIGSDLEDEDYSGVVDAVLLWWREEDGDLVDALVDALPTLGEGGFIALVTPGQGQPGMVEPSVVDESAATAGLHTAGRAAVGDGWMSTRLVTPKSPRR